MLGVPVQTKALGGIDSLLSIAQMPSGIPVATFAIGAAGARNAALFAAALLANEFAEVRVALDTFRAAQTAAVLNKPDPRQHLKPLNVGIVGAGQLGRMMALAGYPLGIRCSFLDKSVDAPAAQVAPILTGGLEDPVLLAELASKSDVLTFDWENISGRALAPLESLTKVRPPRAALEVSQDRLHEKAMFKRLKIPVAEHAAVDSRQDLAEAARKLGTPGVLKTRRMGYDGKGQVVVKRPEDIDAAWVSIGAPGLIYEKFQAFSMEVSLVAARSPAGDIVYYPLVGEHPRRRNSSISASRPMRTARSSARRRIYMKRVLVRARVRRACSRSSSSWSRAG